MSALVATAVYCILDPSNLFVAPTTGSMLIGLILVIGIACFGSNGVALNTARDLGARFAMASIYGRKAFPGAYVANTALTNWLGTFIGATFQTLVLSDTLRQPTEASMTAHKHKEGYERAADTRQSTSRANGEQMALARLSGSPKMLPIHVEKASV